MSTKETIPVPFPVDEDPAHTVDVFSGYWKGMDKIYERARVEEVKLDDLVASQEAVDLPYVKKLLKAKKYNDPKRMLILRMPDKTLKIDDGHHTLTAAKLAGLQKVKALVTDIYEEELVKNNMKSSLKELASLLVEQTLSEDDASPDGVFGKWLFGPEQIDAAANKEKNTDIEGDLNSALYKHYIGSPNPDLGKLYFKYVKPELEKGNYTKYLKPPEGYVYRGMTLSSTGFAKIVKIAKHELQDVKSMGKGWYMAQAGVMTPPGSKARSMSWTTDEKQAAKFASTTGDNVNGAKVYAIFTADTNNSENNFMVNPNKVKAGYKDKSVFNQYKEEKEVISVGPVNFIECTFYIDFHKNAVKVSKEQIDELMDIYKKRLPLYIKRDLKNNKYLVILVERIYKTLNAGGNKEQLYSYIRSILISMSGIVDEFTGNRPGGGIEPKNITVELTTTFSGIVDTGKTYQIIAALKKLPVPVSSNDVRDLLQAYIINKLLPRLLTPKNFYITKKPLGVDPTKGLLYAMGFTKKQPKEKPLEIDYNE